MGVLHIDRQRVEPQILWFLATDVSPQVEYLLSTYHRRLLQESTIETKAVAWLLADTMVRGNPVAHHVCHLFPYSTTRDYLPQTIGRTNLKVAPAGLGTAHQV
jgi:hypothetical protein